jgi:hypothetical protein
MALPAHGDGAPEGEFRAAQARWFVAQPRAVLQDPDPSARRRPASRLHKALEDTGIKLDYVASHVLSASGGAILDALKQARPTVWCSRGWSRTARASRSRRSVRRWWVASSYAIRSRSYAG